MTKIVGPPADATRNRPLAKELENVLRDAADATNIDTIRIVSGGQPAKGEGGKRIGSPRHDHGRAADIQLVQHGQTLTFTDRDADPSVKRFVTAAAAYGATGIGAGVSYMGDETLHVGFGTSPKDVSKLVWGAGGRSSNAPTWLREAAQKGWENPVAHAVQEHSDQQNLGRFVVVARDGLWLRRGPGLEYKKIRVLDPGRKLTVVAFDGANSAWARVDLENDGLVDGHVSAAFIKPVNTPAFDVEGVEEPSHEDAA